LADVRQALNEGGVLNKGASLRTQPRSAGYLLRRWLEHRAESEALKRMLLTVSLHQSMRRAGVSIADLDRLEREVTRRAFFNVCFWPECMDRLLIASELVRG
jgi:hypothetical protein